MDPPAAQDIRVEQVKLVMTEKGDCCWYGVKMNHDWTFLFVRLLEEYRYIDIMYKTNRYWCPRKLPLYFLKNEMETTMGSHRLLSILLGSHLHAVA